MRTWHDSLLKLWVFGNTEIIVEIVSQIALGITLGWGAPLYFGLDFGPVMVYVDGSR